MKRKFWFFGVFYSELTVFTTGSWSVYFPNMCFCAESINTNDIIIIITGWFSTLTCIKAHIWNICSKFCCLPLVIFGLNIRQVNKSGIVIKRNGKLLIRILKVWGCFFCIASFHSTRYRKIKNLIHCSHVITRRNVVKTRIMRLDSRGLKIQCLLYLILCTDSKGKCI